MPIVEYRLLGPVEAVRDGDPVPVGGSTALSLLAGLLLSANRVVSTERLTEIVWAGHRPARPRSALHSAVSRLRRIVGGGALEGSTTGYRLNVDVDGLDLSRSDRLVDAADAARRRGALDEAAAALDEALGLWRERPLGNVDSPELLAEAARLVEKHLVMHEQYADLCLRLGRHATVVELLTSLVLAQPYRERPVGQLMTALFHSGRQVEALAAYESLDAALRGELGIAPSPWLRDLHVRILRADAEPEIRFPSTSDASQQTALLHPAMDVESSPETEAAPPVVSSAQPSDGRLPWRGLRPPSQRLVGRDREIEELCGAVRGERAVTLVGTAGVGKTALALKAAEQMASEFRDGVAVVELGSSVPAGGRRGTAAVLEAVWRTLGGGAVPEQGVEEAVPEALRGRELLLLLDNAEHVAGACGRAVDLIVRSCPEISILTTSRRAVGVGVEAVVELSPLDAGSAAELLRLRTAGHRPGLDLGADAGGVAELCRQLDGLPLAIELAARRLRTMSLRALLRRVGRQQGLLAGANGAHLPHQRAMDTTLEWSHRLLTRPAQLLLHRLAVFEDRFTLEDVERVAGPASADRDEAVVLLGVLVEHCLVQAVRDADGYAYRVLVPVRRFVLGRPAPLDGPVPARRCAWQPGPGPRARQRGVRASAVF